VPPSTPIVADHRPVLVVGERTTTVTLIVVAFLALSGAAYWINRVWGMVP
jgi:hypothetical protein